MSDMDQGPHHLAEVVGRALSVTDAALPAAELPDPALLDFFFHVLYQASFRGEPGRPVIGAVLWQDPTTLLSPVLPGPERLPWSCLSFSHPVPFNVNSLVSLMQGLDPQLSAVAVHAADPRHPVIHGLVSYRADPSMSPVSSWEEEDSPSGSFRATLAGPAHLLVDVGFEHQIELARNQLYTHAHNVLRRGPVRDRLSTHLDSLLPLLKAQLPPDIAASPFFEARSLPLAGGSVLINEAEWSEMTERLWAGALVQILLQIFQTQQGGAVLVTPNRARNLPAEERLTLTYVAEYPQLRLLLEQRSLSAMTQHVLSAKALSERTRPLGEMSPEDLALHEPKLADGPAGSDAEIRQAAAFLASLARMEGLLLLSPQLDLCGFGGQPGAERHPEEVYLAGDELATEAHLSAIPYRSFGPRNRALIRQCYQDRDALAFAFTQDGDLRAMMWLEDKIVIWDRVRLRGV